MDTPVLDKLRQAIGDAHVLTSPQDLERYSQCTIPWDKRCGAIVFPQSIEDVQKIVRLANEFHFPLKTFGRGKNWGYGTTCVLEEGTVLLILKRMNQIFEVNEELAYAVIGPGVSYGELNTYLKSHQLKLWADCTDSTPHGSVLGNALERGVGYTQNGDHFGSLCGLEVVLPDGTLLQTGGGPSNSRTFHTYKYGTGPYLEGLFSQSNFGIVVKAGIWLMPEPERFTFFSCEIDNAKDYPAVIDVIRRLALAKVVTSHVHMANAFMAMLVAMPYPYDRLQGAAMLSNAQLLALQKEYHLAPWLVSGGLYGPKEQVAVSEKLIRQELGRFGKLTFIDDRKVQVLNTFLSWIRRTKKASLLHSLLLQIKNLFVSRSPVQVIEALMNYYPTFKGVPSGASLPLAYAKRKAGRPSTELDPVRDHCGLLWLAPVAPLTDRDSQIVIDLCTPVFEKHGFEFLVVFLAVNPRSVVVLMQIAYDKENPEETRRALALYEEVAALTLQAGYPQYRTSVAYMNRILKGSEGFEDLLKRLKSAIDPHDILSPGHYGIK